MQMDSLKVSEVIRREFKIDFAGSDCRKVVFCLIQCGIVTEPQAVAQNGSAWVAVRILADAIFIQNQPCR